MAYGFYMLGNHQIMQGFPATCPLNESQGLADVQATPMSMAISGTEIGGTDHILEVPNMVLFMFMIYIYIFIVINLINTYIYIHIYIYICIILIYLFIYLLI